MVISRTDCAQVRERAAFYVKAQALEPLGMGGMGGGMGVMVDANDGNAASRSR